MADREQKQPPADWTTGYFRNLLRSPPYLLISQLEIVVGDPPVEVLCDLIADLMQRLGAQLRINACVHTCSPAQHYVAEAQVREGFIKRVLVQAPQPAPDPGPLDFTVAA